MSFDVTPPPIHFPIFPFWKNIYRSSQFTHYPGQCIRNHIISAFLVLNIQIVLHDQRQTHQSWVGVTHPEKKRQRIVVSKYTDRHTTTSQINFKVLERKHQCQSFLFNCAIVILALCKFFGKNSAQDDQHSCCPLVAILLLNQMNIHPHAIWKGDESLEL